MGIDKLDEDDLYENLAWLDEHQESIERKLFALRFPESVPTLFLYDVTSSYLEGACNELADWGCNRDGKKAKMGQCKIRVLFRVSFLFNVLLAKTITFQRTFLG